MKEYYRVQANIQLNAIRENVINARKLLREDTKLMAIIKADGYGHGAVQAAEALGDLADAFGVAILEEGIELRQAGIQKPILILGYTPEPLYRPMIRYDIATAVFTWEMAQQISRAAVEMGQTARIHIKLDTGMSRIGFDLSEESRDVIRRISCLPNVLIEGCFTHFARMDEKDKTWAKHQFTKFMDFTARLEADGIKLGLKHAANSAGIIEMPEVQLDMVRDGISLYGLYPSQDVRKERLPLIPVMEVVSNVSFVKKLPPGVQIGYGGTYTTERETLVATIPVGYADGYPRALSGRGRILIHGQSAPILGRICMDQFMVDVTQIQNVQQGDRVTLVGRDGEEFIPVEEVAEMSYSFNYEFVCDIGKRIPRVYFRGGRCVATRDYYPEY